MQLKPCPFCGGEPRYTTVHFAGDSFYTVSCDCGVLITDDTDVLERWNRRATETPNRERISAERTCQPVMRGCIYVCSECGEDVDEVPNYCPGCGAKVMWRW